VTINCNGGMGISVFANLQSQTTNNVFFFITEGGPLASLGTMVSFSNTDTSYSFITSDPFGGEIVENVPYGDYSYTVSKDCYMTTTGDVTVDCNSGMGVSVFANLMTQMLNTNVIQSGDTLTAEATGESYQWVDCNNNFALIDGATEQSFFATESGAYAVIINPNSDCADTSECITILPVGLEEVSWPNEVHVYPNPVLDLLTVEAGNNIKQFEIRIINAIGQKVMQETSIDNERIQIEVSQLQNGVYFIQLVAQEAQLSIPFVKN